MSYKSIIISLLFVLVLVLGVFVWQYAIWPIIRARNIEVLRVNILDRALRLVSTSTDQDVVGDVSEIGGSPIFNGDGLGDLRGIDLGDLESEFDVINESLEEF